MREVGAAAMPIIPTFDGIKSDLERGLNDPMRSAGKKGGKDFGDSAGDSMRSSLSQHAKKAALLAAGAIAGTGAVAGAGFVKYLGEALDRGAVEDRLAAALGATPQIAEQYGQVASNLYAGAWGESFDEVAHGVEAVGSSFRRLKTAEDLERVSAQALNFAGIFETDITDAVAKASTVVKSGLAKNATEAFDLLTAASQRVPAALRGDLLDAAEEYSQFFRAAGIEGPQAFTLLVRGARKGQYGLDKIGDAIKEFGIRATDLGDTGAQDALKTLGLSGEQVGNDLLSGGEKANKATQAIVSGLIDVKDPAKQAALAVALFGTPLEDLGKTDIPKFLSALDAGKKGLGDFQGSIDRAGDTLNDNAQTRFTSFKRSLEQNVIDFLGDKAVPVIERDVLPALERFGKWFDDKGAPAIETFIEDARPVAEEVLPAIGNGVDAIGGFLKTAAPLAKDLVGAFNDMPDWITDTAVLGALGLGVASKVKGGKGGLAGGLLGGGKGASAANPMYVFVVNGGAGPLGGGGKGGKGGGGVPPVLGTPGALVVAGTAYYGGKAQLGSTQSLFNSIDPDGNLADLRKSLEGDLGKYADDLKIDLDKLATELYEVGSNSEYVQTALGKIEKAAKPGLFEDLTSGINPFSNKVTDLSTALDHINAELSTLDRRARDRKNLADLAALTANDKPGNGLGAMFGSDARTGKAFDKIPEAKLKVLQDPATIKTQEDAKKLLGNVDSLTRNDFRLIFSALGLKKAKDDAKELEDTLRRLSGFNIGAATYGPGFVGPVPTGTRRTADRPATGGLNVGRIDVHTNDSNKFIQDLRDRSRREAIGGYS